MTGIPLKGKVLNWLPGMRWVPHDLPANDSSSKQHRSLFTTRKSKAPKQPDHGTPHRRKSTISISSTPDPELDARTYPQGQSMFVAKLPIEIRMIVYEYVVGEETVHLTIGAKRRFGHFICEEGDGEREGECGCRVLVGGRETRRLGIGGLAMMRTCRRLYTEAISHLYTRHTFSLLHVTHLLYLPSRIPTPRLNTIRTLRLRWAIRALPYLLRGPAKRIAYPEDTSNWARGWSIIAGMQGLRDLYVVLVDPSREDLWETSWLELEGQLLQPVREVTRPRWFELVLPYASCDLGWDMGASRVRLRKPEGEGDGQDE